MALAIVAMALAGCGSNRTAQLGFADCVRAWNAPDNAERRERVAASVVRVHARWYPAVVDAWRDDSESGRLPGDLVQAGSVDRIPRPPR